MKSDRSIVLATLNITLCAVVLLGLANIASGVWNPPTGTSCSSAYAHACSPCDKETSVNTYKCCNMVSSACCQRLCAQVYCESPCDETPVLEYGTGTSDPSVTCNSNTGNCGF